jgi:hypothetical protein
MSMTTLLSLSYLTTRWVHIKNNLFFIYFSDTDMQFKKNTGIIFTLTADSIVHCAGFERDHCKIKYFYYS